MKKLIILLLLALLCTTAQAFQSIDFIVNDLAATQKQATFDNKGYFVHVTATWCMPCQWMERNTFTDAALCDYVRQHYLAAKIEFDHPEGIAFKKQYQVTTLPSTLIFDAQGRLLARYDNSLSAVELLKILQEYAAKTNHSKPQRTMSSAVQVAYQGSGISRPALIPDGVTTVTEQPPHRPVTYAALPTEKPQPASPAIADATAPKGNYTIQTGVYSDQNNALRNQKRLEERFQQPVRVTETQNNGKTLYRVLVGVFANRNAAEDYLLYLERQAVPGFVKLLE